MSFLSRTMFVLSLVNTLILIITLYNFMKINMNCLKNMLDTYNCDTIILEDRFIHMDEGYCHQREVLNKQLEANIILIIYVIQ